MEIDNLINLICIIIAVIVFYQLYTILGTRTGNEKPPFDLYKSPTAQREESLEGKDAFNGPVSEQNEEEIYKEIDQAAPPASPLNEALRAIRMKDASFSLKSFKQGAQLAYEMILTAFSEGKIKELEPLLNASILHDFSKAIQEREQRGETVEFTFVGVNKLEIVAACLEEQDAFITVKLKSEIISATYDRDKNLIEGDRKTILPIQDCWTFCRSIKDASPNWKLVATEEDEPSAVLA